MDFLPLEIKAPLQSWGARSRFTERDTLSFPTKSGIIGLLAAALGITRDDEEGLKTLSSLDIAVRIDSPGKMAADFQIMNTSEGSAKANNKIVYRDYLEDAAFLVGVYGDYPLEDLHRALQNPRYSLFLGRKSCPPSGPLTRGVEGYSSVTEFLRDYPILVPKNQLSWEQRNQEKVTLTTVTTDAKSRNTVDDSPRSFSNKQRLYTSRGIKYGKARVLNPYFVPAAEHDPMELL